MCIVSFAKYLVLTRIEIPNSMCFSRKISATPVKDINGKFQGRHAWWHNRIEIQETARKNWYPGNMGGTIFCWKNPIFRVLKCFLLTENCTCQFSLQIENVFIQLIFLLSYSQPCFWVMTRKKSKYCVSNWKFWCNTVPRRFWSICCKDNSEDIKTLLKIPY